MGKSIIMISSDMAEILGICDRILIMHEGEISGELISGRSFTRSNNEICSRYKKLTFKNVNLREEGVYIVKTNFKNVVLKYKSLIGLLILCIVISFITPRFLSIANIKNVLTQVSVNAVIAIGMSFVILTGGIDLSVGSILAVSGAVAASILKSTGNLFLAIIVALAIGCVIGLINGVLVSKGRIQAFIVTLATMTIFRGVTYVFTNGTPISGLGQSFSGIGNKMFLGLPIPVVIMVIVFGIAFYVLSQTRYGRYVYALRWK